MSSPSTTINANLDENDSPLITNWMITTFIVAGSVITFWALCICALAICLLRLYWKAKKNAMAERINSTEQFDKSKSKLSKTKKFNNHRGIGVNDNSDDSEDTQYESGITGSPSNDTVDDNDDLFVIKDTHNLNLEESTHGEPSNAGSAKSKPIKNGMSITNTNHVIPTSMRKPKKRYSMRAITIDHTALHNKYHSAPVPRLTNSIEPNMAFNFKHYSNPSGMGNGGPITMANVHIRTSGSLSNDSHPLGSRHYYHPQPPSVDIATLKQLMYNDQYQQSNDMPSKTQIVNKYQSNDNNASRDVDKLQIGANNNSNIDDHIVNIKMSHDHDEDNNDTLDIDDSSDEDEDGSDDEIYIKPQSSDIHLTPTLGGALVTPIGTTLTPLDSKDEHINECKDGPLDGFPDTKPIAMINMNTRSINMEETEQSQSQSQTQYITQSTRMNIQNPPPTVISDHSVYPSIPSMNQHIPPNINVNMPIGPFSMSNSKSPMINGPDPSSFSAIYEKGVTPDGLNMFNTTITGLSTSNNNNNTNDNSILQQPSSGPSIFKSLTNQQKTAAPTYKLPKYNVTKGQWM